MVIMCYKMYMRDVVNAECHKYTIEKTRVHRSRNSSSILFYSKIIY